MGSLYLVLDSEKGKFKPLQDNASCCKLYPGLQEHLYELIVLWQLCAHASDFSKHSLISERKNIQIYS